MTGGYVFALCSAVAVLAFMFELLRRRTLREKYAALWIALALVVGVAALFPALTERVAALVGVVTPINLVFFLGILVLLGVCVQLSAETSGLELENQTLAEECALLRARVERLEAGIESPRRTGPGGSGDATDA